MKVTVDRFESSFAVVQLPDRSTANLPTALVPGAKEGDIIEIRILPEETARRKKNIQQLAKKLWADES